jgi:hypothetical protein
VSPPARSIDHRDCHTINRYESRPKGRLQFCRLKNGRESPRFGMRRRNARRLRHSLGLRKLGKCGEVANHDRFPADTDNS